MRKFNYKNCSVHAITTLLVALFTIQTGQAQGRINSNQTTGNNGQWGPTAVIATTQGSTYGSSKTNGFTITGPRSRANPFAWHLINKKAFTIFDKKKK